jgi:hypothetical protein
MKRIFVGYVAVYTDESHREDVLSQSSSKKNKPRKKSALFDSCFRLGSTLYQYEATRFSESWAGYQRNTWLYPQTIVFFRVELWEPQNL